MAHPRIPVAAALAAWLSTPGRSAEHRRHAVMHKVLLRVEDVVARIGWGDSYEQAVLDAFSDRGLAEATRHNREALRRATRRAVGI